ncbi:MAG: DUF4926 domain-containing protein [Pirellulales bacterium]
MTLQQFSEVALARDLPDTGLRRGDVATIVDRLPATDAGGGEDGFVLEVFNAVGETIAVVTVPISAVEPLRPTDVQAVRPFQQAG